MKNILSLFPNSNKAELVMTDLSAAGLKKKNTNVVSLKELAKIHIADEVKKIYEMKIKEGMLLIAVMLDERIKDDIIREILENHGGEQIRTI